MSLASTRPKGRAQTYAHRRDPVRAFAAALPSFSNSLTGSLRQAESRRLRALQITRKIAAEQVVCAGDTVQGAGEASRRLRLVGESY